MSLQTISSIIYASRPEERKITTWPAKYCKCDNTLEATMSVFANQNKYCHKWTAVTRKSHCAYARAIFTCQESSSHKSAYNIAKILLYMYNFSNAKF